MNSRLQMIDCLFGMYLFEIIINCVFRHAGEQGNLLDRPFELQGTASFEDFDQVRFLFGSHGCGLSSDFQNRLLKKGLNGLRG